MPTKKRTSAGKSKQPQKKVAKGKKEPEEQVEEEEENMEEEEIEVRKTTKSTAKQTGRVTRQSAKSTAKESKPAKKKQAKGKAKKSEEEEEEIEEPKKPVSARKKRKSSETSTSVPTTAYEFKNVSLRELEKAPMKKKISEEKEKGPFLTVELVTQLFAQVRDQLEDKIKEKIHDDPKVDANAIRFYKEGLEDGLTMIKNKLPADFAVEAGPTVLPPIAAETAMAPMATTLAAPTAPPQPIIGFKGETYTRGFQGYEEHRYQYAFSSVEKKSPGKMNPMYIMYPKDDEDVVLVIRYARSKNVKIAVRTGGHQYSGASSTNGDNILLDMSQTYFDFQQEDNGLIKTGISFTLREFNSKLSQKGMFVPHGQCSHVHLGGHVQTGGYGQLGRSFGLFADHVEKIRIITADEKIREISRNATDEDDKNLFWAVLGGSPGNLGILTHIWIRPYKDEDHPNSRGMKAIYVYSKERLQKLLDVVVDMTADENFQRNYDLCVTVLSFAQLIVPHLFPNADQEMKERHPEIYGRNDLPLWGPMIVVYAQWADLGKLDPNQKPCDLGWFKKIKDAAGTQSLLLSHGVDYKKTTPMSKLTQAWIFGNVREYLLPYEKRTYLTNWTQQLREKQWTEWVSNRIDEIQKNPLNGCKLSIQIQNYGGNFSQFRMKADDKTAYSWRDSTICCVMDCFYDKPHWSFPEDPYVKAHLWQVKNDEEARGNENARFCNEDRRVLWGSYDSDLALASKYYYEPGKWEKLLNVKKKFDPQEIFTPNKFCVSETAPEEPELPPMAAAARVAMEMVVPEPDATFEGKMVTKLVERREHLLEDMKNEDESLVPPLKDEQDMCAKLAIDKELMKSENPTTPCCK